MNLLYCPRMATEALHSFPDSRALSSRDRMLQSARHLFASRGYENTSTVMIARAAGTSESQLVKHFGSKEGLLEAIFDEGWANLQEALHTLDAVPSPAVKLRMILEVTLAGLDSDRDLKELMLLEGRRIRKEGHMVVMTRGFRGFIQLVDNTLAEMRAAGQLRPDLNPEALRSGVIGMFEGMMRDLVLMERAGMPLPYTSEDLRKMFDVVIPALAPPPQ